MLAKPFRLNARVRLHNTKTVSTLFFTLRYSANVDMHNRYGFVVSKKTAKNAVDRNRIKRKVRATIEKLHEHLMPGYDMLFLLKDKALEEPVSSLYSSAEEVFAKEGLLQ